MAKPDLAKLKAFYDKIRDDFIPKEVQESPVSKDRKTIAIYGKAGIGKSTTSCNLSAAAAQLPRSATSETDSRPSTPAARSNSRSRTTPVV